MFIEDIKLKIGRYYIKWIIIISWLVINFIKVHIKVEKNAKILNEMYLNFRLFVERKTFLWRKDLLVLFAIVSYAYSKPKSSTSNVKVAFGGMTPG